MGRAHTVVVPIAQAYAGIEGKILGIKDLRCIYCMF